MILAHGVGGSTDLPLPLEYAMVGAAWALTISFAVLALAWRRPRLDPTTPGGALPPWVTRAVDSGVTRAVLGLVGVGFTAWVALAAFGGDPGPANGAPGAFYVLLWVGLVALSLWIAYRSRPVFVPVSGPEDPIARYRTVIIQRLRLFAIGIPTSMFTIGTTGDVHIARSTASPLCTDLGGHRCGATAVARALLGGGGGLFLVGSIADTSPSGSNPSDRQTVGLGRRAVLNEFHLACCRALRPVAEIRLGAGEGRLLAEIHRLGEVIDHVGGEADIAARRVRCLHSLRGAFSTSLSAKLSRQPSVIVSMLTRGIPGRSRP